MLDDGKIAQDIVLNQEMTYQVTGIDVRIAKKMAMDAVDPAVVLDEIKRSMLGKYFTVRGRVSDGRYLLVNEMQRTAKDISLEEVLKKVGAVQMPQARGVAKRVFAKEFKASDMTFKEGEDQFPEVSADADRCQVQQGLHRRHADGKERHRHDRVLARPGQRSDGGIRDLRQAVQPGGGPGTGGHRGAIVRSGNRQAEQLQRPGRHPVFGVRPEIIVPIDGDTRDMSVRIPSSKPPKGCRR